MRTIVFALLLLAGCASVRHAVVEPTPVIEVERAFAARAGEIGWIAAFREYTAPDGQVAQAEIVSAPETLAAAPGDGARTLYWQPAFAGIARSGDLGFTTGAYSTDEARTPAGQYFTVWRRQPDGGWKWIWDGGPGPVSDPPAFTDEVATLPVAETGAGSAEAAAAQVRALETEAGTSGALAAWLAPDAHVYRPRQPRAIGAAAAAAMRQPSADVAYRLMRVVGSADGDMVFTLGEAEWEGGRAFFSRIWQLRPEGWRIVYDQLAPRASPGD